MDLELLDCFGRKKNPSYNRRNTVIDSGLLIVNDMGRAKQYCLFLSVLVIYVCLKREKNLTLKTCAPDFPAHSMTKL